MKKTGKLFYLNSIFKIWQKFVIILNAHETFWECLNQESRLRCALEIFLIWPFRAHTWPFCARNYRATSSTQAHLSLIRGGFERAWLSSEADSRALESHQRRIQEHLSLIITVRTQLGLIRNDFERKSIPLIPDHFEQFFFNFLYFLLRDVSSAKILISCRLDVSYGKLYKFIH